MRVISSISRQTPGGRGRRGQLRREVKCAGSAAARIPGKDDAYPGRLPTTRAGPSASGSKILLTALDRRAPRARGHLAPIAVAIAKAHALAAHDAGDEVLARALRQF